MGENKPLKRRYTLPNEGSPVERVQNWLTVSLNAASEGYNGHDANLSKILKLESVKFEPTSKHPHDARTVFSFEVTDELCNMTGNLHGGAVALIFDITTSTALMAASSDGFWDTVSNQAIFQNQYALGHVSRTLNCTYLRPAPVGTKIFVENQVVHMGKRLAQTTGIMRIGTEDGKICYTCEHGKAAVGSSSL